MSQSQKILRIIFKFWFFNVSHGSVWRLVRGWRFQSRGYSKIFVAYLVTFSWVELSRKTLKKNFKFFVLSVLATCSRLSPDVKITCFAQIGQFLKRFKFPSNIL